VIAYGKEVVIGILSDFHPGNGRRVLLNIVPEDERQVLYDEKLPH
jgi:hypothetical protein